MLWTCSELKQYWENVLEDTKKITGRNLAATPAVALLGNFIRPQSKKMTSKFIDLALILAKREITMRWKDPRGPRVLKWKDTLIKWTEGEGEALRQELAKGMGSEEGIQQWDTIFDRLKHPTTEPQEQTVSEDELNPEDNDIANRLSE
ncbi:hypothetical protein NDU88_002179 [Pleurodeles waltl]|uniref:Uncharacterized protein n=1 Tax=Pleurodeles waltl TaxID=8319 RepID=A0AAV7R987_PLEWA|nr:hypothetical protein NDU88_002179 [Pleurodeles waltl]